MLIWEIVFQQSQIHWWLPLLDSKENEDLLSQISEGYLEESQHMQLLHAHRRHQKMSI